jgi:hypothetical protein
MAQSLLWGIWGLVVLYVWPSPYKAGRSSRAVHVREVVYGLAMLVYVVVLLVFLHFSGVRLPFFD